MIASKKAQQVNLDSAQQKRSPASLSADPKHPSPFRERRAPVSANGIEGVGGIKRVLQFQIHYHAAFSPLGLRCRKIAHPYEERKVFRKKVLAGKAKKLTLSTWH